MLLTAGRAVDCFLRGARPADGVLLISRDEPGRLLGDETEAPGSCIALQCPKASEHWPVNYTFKTSSSFSA